VQNKPKGKPPKTAMGSRVHSSQRHLAESNSNSDSDSASEADADFAADSKGGGVGGDGKDGAKATDNDDNDDDDKGMTFPNNIVIYIFILRRLRRFPTGEGGACAAFPCEYQLVEEVKVVCIY
jgi:hypothetical protein